MRNIAGIGKFDRQRLTAILRGTRHTISVQEAAKILNIPPREVSKLLAKWVTKGWLSRIKRGLYIPIPIESETADISIEDPFIIAEKLYAPCYIGGWSAAEYWGLTEQIFRTIVVLTVRKPKNRYPNFKNTNFLLHTISSNVMFGLKPIWRGQVKVLLSDPARTLLDMLSNPKLGGGIRSTIDILMNYLKSEHKNLMLLLEYAKKLNNGTVFKRLGFLLEEFAPEELNAIDFCKKQLTAGKIKLDPGLTADKLITRWQLWIPKEWTK